MEQQRHRAAAGAAGAAASSEDGDPGKSEEGSRCPYGRHTVLLVLVVLSIGFIGGSTYVSTFLVQGDKGDPTRVKSLADPEQLAILHQRPTKQASPPGTETNLTKTQSSRLHEVIKKDLPHANMPTASSSEDNSRAESGDDSWAWANAGGEFGLSGDWREALLSAKSGGSLRGDGCSGADSREEVRRILDRRNRTPPKERVAACVRTKDFGRYLPEWIAYHYAIGVDEIVIYDDDSVDGTREILQPFVGAGIVSYVFFKVEGRMMQMKPLNDCLMRFKRRRASQESCPKWILFHDTDEYIFPVNTERSISETLELHNRTCCLQVNRVQYGSSGYRETPRGLVIDNFLRHATVRDVLHNRLPKVVVNLSPAHPELGKISPVLRSMHDGAGCKCDKVSSKDVLINHYLGSVGDFVDKTKRYWQSNHSLDKVEKYLKDRDINTVMTDTITHWGCATREILARIDEKLDLRTGLSLSPNKR